MSGSASRLTATTRERRIASIALQLGDSYPQIIAAVRRNADVEAPALVVMAAGIGSRYGGIKQMEPFGPGGEILLDYSVYDAIQSGFEDIIFVLRDEIQADFREHVEPRLAKHCNVQYAMQRLDAIPEGEAVPASRVKPWGTAHAVLACKDQITGPFGVINADDFYGREAFGLLFDFLEGLGDGGGASMALVGYELRKTLTEHGHVSRGVCRVSEAGTLKEIVERKKVRRFGDAIRYEVPDGGWVDVEPDATASMNMWGFGCEFLAQLEERLRAFFVEHRDDLDTAEFLLPEVVGALVRASEARVGVLHTAESWFGVTYPDDRPRVEEAIRRLTADGVYPSPLWAR